MKPKLFIRITSILIFIFAVGHSIGHFTRYNTIDPQALNTISVMQKTKIPMESVTKSYDQFYTGMSLNLSIFLISLTILLWFLSNFTESNPKATLKLLIPIFFCIFCFSITSFIYFFLAPALVSLLGTFSLLISIILLKKS
ncbi:MULTISPECIES: LIC_13387 family protein [Leptospira]|uniref:Uncharacterized protein n=6 Tax=Leptospira borgpetersenii TaxID=174 RepID=M3H0L2_LEPBO|nr:MULTISPECIES: hypothetical protein [Leptospira]EMG00619.1 hypothetical protein LEP1GSC123_1943 [Leptospira borgpetersenii str. 200701203]EMO07681.1 hypothetical protein LEP1GSC137_0995 [Leptospira borgpetersenii str. Noumea 25]ABJ77310.1 Hypothetical protein LBJ_2910 [Leptospira borgpetersenii serovar Hardjo-bovis str. JB197]ABJ77771.1 Hypothetical protein LBL_0153 [Leptospira borgpetersenii serovar Hardjo-bovis str. L550]ALO28067.1 hypothetical protein LBBP_03906 [Leptospira borgpetersenii